MRLTAVAVVNLCLLILGCAGPLTSVGKIKQVANVFQGKPLTTRELIDRKLVMLPEDDLIAAKKRIQYPPVVGELRTWNGPLHILSTSIILDMTFPWDLVLYPVSDVTWRRVQTACAAICEGAYIYIETNKYIGVADSTAAMFPQIKKDTVARFGAQDFDVDGDPNVYIIFSPALIENRVDAEVDWYNLDITMMNSNGADIIVINPEVLKIIDLRSILAHELTHLLEFSHDILGATKYRWLFEGVANLNVFLSGFPLPPNAMREHTRPNAFLKIKNPNSDDEVAEYRTSAFDFAKFLYETYGMDAVTRIIQNPHQDKKSIARSAGTTWDVLWQNYLDHSGQIQDPKHKGGGSNRCF